MSTGTVLLHSALLQVSDKPFLSEPEASIHAALAGGLKFSYLCELDIAFYPGSVTMVPGSKINIGIRHFCFKLHA